MLSCKENTCNISNNNNINKNVCYFYSIYIYRLWCISSYIFVKQTLQQYTATVTLKLTHQANNQCK